MSCPHGNHPYACDICDEVEAAYKSGVEHTKQNREWVGLTGEEIINMSCGDLHYAALMGDVVRKLKEKNT